MTTSLPDGGQPPARFDEPFEGQLSPIILCHQLRTSAMLMDQESKRTTGWADTSDRAERLREAAYMIEQLDAAVIDKHSALTKISAIRDSIVGMQGFNFSEHAYPLVAVLGEAGYEGAGYEISRKNLGTLTDQIKAAEARIAKLEEDAARITLLADESWDLRCFSVPTGGDDGDIGWRVVGHWMAEPRERTIGEVFHDDPRAAIDEARRAASGRT